jgi:hypothetical protein
MGTAVCLHTSIHWDLSFNFSWSFGPGSELCASLCSDLTYADNFPNNDGNKCVLHVNSTSHHVLLVDCLVEDSSGVSILSGSSHIFTFRLQVGQLG